jgi:hypothetical protein
MSTATPPVAGVAYQSRMPAGARHATIRLLVFVVCALVFGFACVQLDLFARSHHVDPGSPYWGWFGVLTVFALWFLSATLTNDWNPFALAMGADNRLSTSKFQVWLWTAAVGFVYMMVYADRAISVGHYEPLTAIPQNVLIALGISVTSAVAAQAITGSKVAANPGATPPNPTPSYDPSALVRNDDQSTASLTKVQLLFWTLISVVVFLVTAFDSVGTIATCVPKGTAACGLPDVDTTLMLFMGLGHATYLGGKLATPGATSGL